MPTSRDYGWLSRKFIHPRKVTKRKAPPSCRLGFEPLEERRLLALIVPALSSNPGAVQTLYLDFDGSAPFLWDGAGTGTPYVVRGPSPDDAPIGVPAFTTDADANNFSDPEITNIRNIFAWVAEKFSPFTINVTTVDPGIVFDSQNMTCLIGGSSSDWLGQVAGGVSDLDGFVDGGENTCFAFSGNAVAKGLSGVSLEAFVGETIAHEAGHEVGLSHQRQTISGDAIDEYYDGDSIRAPIMGGSSNNRTGRGIWWLTGNWPGQNSPDGQQDDLLALTQDAPQRLFFRPNGFDIPEMVFGTAGVLTQLKGVIPQTGDVDGFRFQATGARASFQIKNAPFGGMLAPTASIRISGTSTLIPANLTVTNTSATIEATNLTPGTNYVLQIGSQGGYGDIGQFTVDGTQQQFAAYDAASRTVNVGGFIGNNNVTLRSETSTNSLIVEDSLNGGPTSSQSFPLNGVDTVIVFLGNGNDTLNVARLVHADNSPVNVSSNLGGGSDILRLGATDISFTTFNVSRFAVEWTDGGTRTSRVFDSTAERLELRVYPEKIRRFSWGFTPRGLGSGTFDPHAVRAAGA